MSYRMRRAPRLSKSESKVAVALGLEGAGATAAQLRAVPAEKFTEIKGQGLSNAPVPISGDTVLPQSIQATFAAGKQARLPLILGNTSDDTSVVAAFGVDAVAVFKRLGAAGFLVRALYPGVKDDTELARQATRDLVFTMPVRWLADRHAKHAATWRYYFDYTAVKLRKKFSNGVPHGAEIAYFMNTVDTLEGTKGILTAEDRAFARRTSDYVFEFARTGKPTASDSPTWANHRITARQDADPWRDHHGAPQLHARPDEHISCRQPDRGSRAGPARRMLRLTACVDDAVDKIDRQQLAAVEAGQARRAHLWR